MTGVGCPNSRICSKHDSPWHLKCEVKVLDPIELSESLDNFATLLQDQGDLTRARAFYQRALDIREELSRNSDTAETLDHLARLLADMGELHEARSLYQRTLLIREKILDPKNPIMIQNIESL